MIEIDVQTNSLSEAGVREALRGFQLPDAFFHFVPDVLGSGVVSSSDQVKDRRSRLDFGDLSHLYVALSVPATYVLKKLLDPTIEGLGKAIYLMLRRAFQVIKKRSQQRKRPLHLILEFSPIKYILICSQDVRLSTEDVVAALACARLHFLSAHIDAQISQEPAAGTYELTQTGRGWEVRNFDPLS